MMVNTKKLFSHHSTVN